MEKKTLSRPMTEILTRLEEFEYIKPLIFPESVIINVSTFSLSPTTECYLYRNPSRTGPYATVS